jgi:hypothetical protein
MGKETLPLKRHFFGDARGKNLLNSYRGYITEMLRYSINRPLEPEIDPNLIFFEALDID